MEAFKPIAGVIFYLLLSFSLQAQADLKCYTCNKPIAGKYWKHKKGAICEPCSKIEKQCWICHIPILRGGIQTRDGRPICSEDAPHVVLDGKEANTIFNKTRSDLLRMTRTKLALKNNKVSVQVFDFDYWNKKNSSNAGPDGMHRAGIAFSRKIGPDLSHSVLLVSGYTKEQVRYTCAHEYTHLWINEALDPKRKIELHTAEAICELVAWKLATNDGSSDSVQSILSNPYTAGRIKTAVELESKHGIASILEWVKRGSSLTLSDGELKKLSRTITSTPRSKPMGSPLYSRSQPKKVSHELKLKGLIGKTDLIGGKAFQKGDTFSLMVNGEKKSVTCVEIKQESVVIKIGTGANQTLTLQ